MRGEEYFLHERGFAFPIHAKSRDYSCLSFLRRRRSPLKLRRLTTFSKRGTMDLSKATERQSTK
jgi:hypothetical protein